MSKVAIKGANTGTGTFTIESPATNTDRTLSLPDATGTILTTATPGVPVNGPAFSATMSANQSVTSSTLTKLQFNTEDYDTNACYDTSLYRFTPTIAGYYQINASIYPNTSTTLAVVSIHKNGVQRNSNQTASAVGVAVSALVYLNGSTDYVECYGLLTGTSPQVWNDGRYVYFQAFLARSAT